MGLKSRNTPYSMKKPAIILVFYFLFLFGFSQTGTFTINFNGKEQFSGNTLALTQVQIINLTRGVDTTLNNGNFIFQLNYSMGIGDHNIEDNNNIIVHPVFPNPLKGSTEITIDIKSSTNLNISLYPELFIKNRKSLLTH